MENLADFRVIAADRLDNSVIITFENGRCGVYSSELLYSMLESARELQETEDGEVIEST